MCIGPPFSEREFVYADLDGAVYARSAEIREWETFTLRFPHLLSPGPE